MPADGRRRPARRRSIHRADLDGLVRLVDDCCAAATGQRLRRLRDRARHAVGTGRQLWPAATLAEYRLALLAPAAWAAGVLDEGSGRFTIGPLTEVVAQHHTWSELAPLLEPGPRAALVAHERALRGELIDDRVRRRSARRPRAAVPRRRLGAGVRRSPCTTTPAPSSRRPRLRRRSIDVDLPVGPSRPCSTTPTVELAVRQLVEPWTASSDGHAEVVAVEGDVAAAVRALGVASARRADAGPGRRRSPGWPGREPAAAPTVGGAARPPVGSARCGCSPPSATPSTTGRCPSTSSAPSPPSCAGAGGTPTSR